MISKPSPTLSFAITRNSLMSEICYPSNQTLMRVDQALAQILSQVKPLETLEHIPIDQASGRILAETVYAPAAIPAHAVAAMDGYGLASQSIQQQAFSCHQVGISWAGNPFAGIVKPGECVRIFTGAVVPEGVDSVVAQEQVSAEGETIYFPEQTANYRNIRAAGSDVPAGQVLLENGTLLSPVALGLLASAGISQVNVIRRLKIGFFSSGDELNTLGSDLTIGQIYDSNRYQLNALLQNPLYQLFDLGILADDPLLLEQTLNHAAPELDVLISTGGASVGDADFIQQCLQKCGEVDLWKIAIKPGKPLAFGRIGECLFFGLPGNPVAVWVSFEKFVRPALIKRAGGPLRLNMRISARCLSALRKRPGREEYQRGILHQRSSGEFTVTPVSGQDSHQLSSASQANCFIVLSHDCAGIAAGENVLVEPLQLTI